MHLIKDARKQYAPDFVRSRIDENPVIQPLFANLPGQCRLVHRRVAVFSSIILGNRQDIEDPIPCQLYALQVDKSVYFSSFEKIRKIILRNCILESFDFLLLFQAYSDLTFLVEKPGIFPDVLAVILPVIRVFLAAVVSSYTGNQIEGMNMMFP